MLMRPAAMCVSRVLLFTLGAAADIRNTPWSLASFVTASEASPNSAELTFQTQADTYKRLLSQKSSFQTQCVLEKSPETSYANRNLCDCV